jgi:Peptidase family M28
MRWVSAACLVTGIACAPVAPAPKQPAPLPPTTRPIASPATPPTAPPQPLGADADRLEADLRFIAKPRPPGSPHHDRVRRRCVEQLEQAGLVVEEQAFATGTNVIGRRQGLVHESVVLSAHYDHIPGCSGADDNATGVAVVLEAARQLAARAHHRSLIVACWDDEERGLNGSMAYAERARERDEPIAVAVSLDGIGVASSEPGSQRLPPGFEAMFPNEIEALVANELRADFIALVGDTPSEPMMRAIESAAAAIELPTQTAVLGIVAKVALRDAHRSDHASFWLHGYPALIVSDSAEFRYDRYHCGAGDDDLTQIDRAFLTKVATAVIRGTDAVLNQHESLD